MGLPVAGNGWLAVSESLVAPAEWSSLRGHATFSCEGCTTSSLRVRDPKLYAVFSVTGAELDEAGWFDMALDGRLADLHRFARRCEL